ncbi:hypothetical protein BC833DRAFT_526557 [Globomyces pollinis-pini]|nr:hypothetical protein BC833DRAFT_526557 [Globomyces pollinis-pini]
MSTVSEKIKPSTTIVCDSKPLQKCLEINNGDRSKCIKEWEEFKTACSNKVKK